MALRDEIEALKPAIAEAAQKVVDSWQQDDEGWDEDFGSGGVCDKVAEEISSVLSGIEGVELVDGGQDGDDHAWMVVYDDVDAFAVDVPPGVYETGAGYSWRKVDGAKIGEDDIVVEPVRRSDVVVAAMARRVALGRTG